jgi:hypothetical protein
MSRTTVDLAESAEKIRQKLAPIYGVGNILSAGLLLLDRLSSDEQKAIIAEVNGIVPDDPSQQAAESARFFIKKFQGLDPKQYAVALQFLPEDESKAIQEMLDTLNPPIRASKHRIPQKQKTA